MDYGCRMHISRPVYVTTNDYLQRERYIVGDTLKGSVSTLAEGGCRDCDRDYSAFE